ncbi:MAG: histidinol-phosphate aminotransferase family protein [Chloroflexi bacterium]|nr:histidinol-phosphate aminotransferase family protein [Chloroflexota bacterium]
MPVEPRKELKDLTACVHGGLDYSELKKLGFRPEDVMDFSVNSNPLPLPQKVKDIMSKTVIDRYPDSESSELKAELAKVNEVTEANLLVSSGAMEIIRLAAQAYLSPEDRAILTRPTFGEYEIACRMSGARLEFIGTGEDDGFKIDIEKIIKVIKRLKPKILFLCNPNNPTGKYLSKAEIEKILDALKDNLLVLDEAYIAFTENAWKSVDLITKGNLLIVRSMTKDYALAGLRLGYAIADEDIINTLKKVCPPWNVNAAAQQVGLYMLKDKEYLKDSEIEINMAKKYVIESMNTFNYRVIPSSTNFFIMEVGDATGFRNKLMAKGILVRDCSSFGLPKYVRIAPRTIKECHRLVEAVKNLSN